MNPIVHVMPARVALELVRSSTCCRRQDEGHVARHTQGIIRDSSSLRAGRSEYLSLRGPGRTLLRSKEDGWAQDHRLSLMDGRQEI